MSDTSFQTFLVSGLMVLIGTAVFLAWCIWRYVDRARDMERSLLVGVGHELRVTLQNMARELGAAARGELRAPSDLLPISHVQLNSALTGRVEADRRALTEIRATYDALKARKQNVRDAMAQGGDAQPTIDTAARATIEAITELYLWEMHKGKPPEIAESTRTWQVRDWMKARAFEAKAIPGLHLRDEVVECLRTRGMSLTPKPLTYTANQYYAMLYDRKADPNAPFWKRKPKPAVEVEATKPETAPPPETVATGDIVH